MENQLADEALRAEIQRLAPWHYDIEVAPGVRTGEFRGLHPDRPELGAPTLLDPFEVMRYRMDGLFGGDMAGRSYLDCGCNGGGYLFAAQQMGAGRSYGFDARQHWIDQARFLARHLPNKDMTFAVHDLAALKDQGLEPFDVTLFSGLFYHLPDPVAGLRIAADLTKEILILNTSTRPARGKSLSMVREGQEHVMSGMDGVAWLPSGLPVLQDILKWCGFPHTRLSWEANTNSPRGWSRLEVAAAREKEAFAHWDQMPRGADTLGFKLWRALPRFVRRRIRDVR